MIAKEIKNFAEPAIFMWLSHSERQTALAELRDSSFDTTKMKNMPTDFDTFVYPSLNYTYFAERIYS